MSASPRSRVITVAALLLLVGGTVPVTEAQGAYVLYVNLLRVSELGCGDYWSDADFQVEIFLDDYLEETSVKLQDQDQGDHFQVFQIPASRGSHELKFVVKDRDPSNGYSHCDSDPGAGTDYQYTTYEGLSETIDVSGGGSEAVRLEVYVTDSDASDAPPHPVQLSYSGVTEDAATLTWTEFEDWFRLDKYEVVGGPARERTVLATYSFSSDTSYALGGLQPDTTHRYSVRSYTDDGFVIDSNRVEFVTSFSDDDWDDGGGTLEKPTGFYYEEVGEDIRFTWDPYPTAVETLSIHYDAHNPSFTPDISSTSSNMLWFTHDWTDTDAGGPLAPLPEGFYVILVAWDGGEYAATSSWYVWNDQSDGAASQQQDDEDQDDWGSPGGDPGADQAQWNAVIDVSSGIGYGDVSGSAFMDVDYEAYLGPHFDHFRVLVSQGGGPYQTQQRIDDHSGFGGETIPRDLSKRYDIQMELVLTTGSNIASNVVTVEPGRILGAEGGPQFIADGARSRLTACTLDRAAFVGDELVLEWHGCDSRADRLWPVIVKEPEDHPDLRDYLDPASEGSLLPSKTSVEVPWTREQRVSDIEDAKKNGITGDDLAFHVKIIAVAGQLIRDPDTSCDLSEAFCDLDFAESDAQRVSLTEGDTRSGSGLMDEIPAPGPSLLVLAMLGIALVLRRRR